MNIFAPRMTVPFGPSSMLAVPSDIFVRGKSPHPPKHKVLDLFAGAGGFSLGFEAAGAHVVAAVEIDVWASQTLAHNHPETTVINRDIVRLSDDEIADAGRGCDVIIGGPPCQGYSVANRKAGDPKDPRNSLFREFIRAVRIVRPKAVLLENVPGLLKRKAQSGEPVIDIILSELRALGYWADFRIIEAQSFGVPQIRPRLFVAAYLAEPRQAFPLPTHGSIKSQDLFHTEKELIPFLSVWDAISDLPDIEARQGAEMMSYTDVAQNEYQALLRAGSSAVFNNVAMNHSQRMVDRFAHVGWGESGADAPIEHRARQRGDYTKLSGKEYSQNNRRMHPDRPCHTVPASFYANFIHPFKNRNFTPREGARIQSFPDWYRFSGKPTVVSTKLLSREGREEELHLCQYNQIGNAVPPVLAYSLGKNIFRQIEEI